MPSANRHSPKLIEDDTMPTYQYACTDPECGNRFELVQSFTDPAVSQCPICSGSVRKVFGSVGVVFKGSGFYRTDSRAAARSSESSSSSDSGKSESSSKSESGSKGSSKPEFSGSKSESKPAAKKSESAPAAASA